MDHTELNYDTLYTVLNERSDGSVVEGGGTVEGNKLNPFYYNECPFTSGEMVNCYFIAAAFEVDDDGNATITYSPKGTAYEWTVPEV